MRILLPSHLRQRPFRLGEPVQPVVVVGQDCLRERCQRPLGLFQSLMGALLQLLTMAPSLRLIQRICLAPEMPLMWEGTPSTLEHQ